MNVQRLFTIVILVLPEICFAQTFKALEFKSKEDYARYETEIMDMSDYLLKTAVDDQSDDTKIAFQNVFKWMQGTPDHGFQLDESITNITKHNAELLVPLLASMTSYVLHLKEKTDASDVKLNSFGLFLTYCENDKHAVKMNKELKKALAAKEKGELRRYLKL